MEMVTAAAGPAPRGAADELLLPELPDGGHGQPLGEGRALGRGRRRALRRLPVALRRWPPSPTSASRSSAPGCACWPTTTLAAVLHPDLLARARSRTRPRSGLRRGPRTAYRVCPISIRSSSSRGATFLHGLSSLEDKLSMAHSLESRVPFLANDLVDFVLDDPGRASCWRTGSRRGCSARRWRPSCPRSSAAQEDRIHAAAGRVVPRGAAGSIVERTLLSERACDRGLFKVEFLRRAIDGTQGAGSATGVCCSGRCSVSSGGTGSSWTGSTRHD